MNTELIHRRIKSDNSWWRSNQIPEDYSIYQERTYFHGFWKLVNQGVLNRAVVLMGPRRVGKTVMMYQAIKALLKNNPSKKVMYFSLDTPIYTNLGLEELYENALDIYGIEPDDCYVFFDEVQYLQDWERHLKVLVDTYRADRFIVSGSAAAALKMKSSESGAGRFTDYFLPPLTFAEFVDLTGQSDLIVRTSDRMWRTTDIVSLNKEFENYINYGGFPELALKKVANPERVIQQDIVEKVLMRDLPSLFGISDLLALKQFFNVIAYRTSEETTYSKLTANYNKAKEFLEYLEAAFLVRRLTRVDVNSGRFKRITTFKIHLTNPSLYSGLFGAVNMASGAFPHLVETALYAQYLHRDYSWLRYANWKKGNNEGEVDLVMLSQETQKSEWAVEVKWSDEPKIRSFKYFLEKNNLRTGWITTKEKEETVKVNGLTLKFIPSSVLAYIVGRNALKET